MASSTTATIVLLLLFSVLAVTTTARPCKTISFITPTFTNPSSSLCDHLTVSCIVGPLFFAVGCAAVLYSIWYFVSHACIHFHDDDVGVLNSKNNGYVALASSTNNNNLKDNKNLKHNNKNLDYNHQQPDSDEAATFVWTPRLNKLFTGAVAHLGVKNVIPETLLALMSVDAGLTLQDVANGGFIGTGSGCDSATVWLTLQDVANGGFIGTGSGSGRDSATVCLFDNDHLNHQQPNSNKYDSSEQVTGCNGEPTRILERSRLVWTPELHKRFVDAVTLLGIKNAVPKTVMQLMSVDGLTRENVASHLQKYRLYLKRMQGLSSSSGYPSADSLFASSVPPQFLSQH